MPHRTAPRSYSLGLVVMLALQATGATLVASALGRGGAEGTDAARGVADRLYGWSTAIAAALAVFQASPRRRGGRVAEGGRMARRGRRK